MNKSQKLIAKFESKSKTYDLPGSHASIKLSGMDSKYMDSIGTNVLHIIMNSEYMSPFKDKEVKVTINVG